MQPAIDTLLKLPDRVLFGSGFALLALSIGLLVAAYRWGRGRG